MIIESYINNGTKVVTISGEVTFENSKEFSESLISLTDCNEHIILDFSKLKYLNSMGLSVIIKIFSKVNKDERKLKLCSLNENICKLFSITQLDKIIDIHEDLDSALNSI